MFKNIKNSISKESLQSYFGLMRYSNTKKLLEMVMVEEWLWGDN